MNSPSQRIVALAIASALALPFSGKAPDGDERGRIDRGQPGASQPGTGLDLNTGPVPRMPPTGEAH